MHIIQFLIVCNILPFSLSDEIEEAFKRVKRIISFEYHGHDILTHLLPDGKCCNITENAAGVCSACSSRIVIVRKEEGNAETEFEVYKGKSPESSVRAYDYKTIKVDPKIYVSDFFVKQVQIDMNFKFQYDLRHISLTDGRIYDYWHGPLTHFVGLFWMNGVHGIHHRTKIIVTFDLFPPDPETSIASFFFYFYKLIWVNRLKSDGKCCNTDDFAGDCKKACPLVIKASITNTHLWTSGRVGYTGEREEYFLKVGGSTVLDVAFKDPIDFTVEFLTEQTNQLIDRIVIHNIQYFPNKEKELDDIMGENGHVQVSMILRYDCVGYSGTNCKYDCQSEEGLRSCRHDTGVIFCSNGSPDLKTCKEETNNTCHISPCENGGVCVVLPKTHVCNCPRGFHGRYCQIPACEYECYKGECGEDNNKCTCEKNYRGDWCDESDCNAEEKNHCHKLSTCLRVRDNATCICQSFAEGPTCSTPVCDPACRVGTCIFSQDGSTTHVMCECEEGYTGVACETPLMLPKHYNLTADIISLTILCIITAMLLKILILLLLPKKSNVKENQKSDVEAKAV
ncbi:hypothetical protein HZS_6378 [Henneguya salminicola]|nr:hypothetical protein HZS_6378 [Henneguya salminicola]